MIRGARHRKRYRAALTVLLGVYAFDRLSADQKAKVEDEVRVLLKYIEPVAGHRRVATWDVRAAYRAVAMARLELSPGIDELTWDALLPPRRPWRAWFQVPPAVVFSFFPMDPATADAKTYLRSHGLDVPDQDPWERGSLGPDMIDGSSRFWKLDELLAHLQKKRRK